MGQKILRVALTTAGAGLLLYLGDYMLLRVRVVRGTAFRTIVVHHFLATPLKDEKEEYDYMGDIAVRCSRSLFPQADSPACWWLARHTTVWE